MDENHQDTAGSKLIATNNKLWTPPLSTRDQKKLDRLRKKSFAQRMGFTGKTPWDFIQLLLIPLVLLVIGSLLSYQQNQTSLQAAADQQRETILKTSLDDIKDLLLNKNLRVSKREDEVRVVARVEVLAALRQLDGGRKGLLMRFLFEAGLLTRSRNDVIVNLRDADLRDADLRDADLRGADLHFANLSNANLGDADLHNADLRNADLSDAELFDAELFDALGNADLRNADLTNADLRGADLRNAYLNDANLEGTDLRSANLSDADLRGADLFGADPSNANLSGALVTQEQLNDVQSLQGTVMPNGSKHP